MAPYPEGAGERDRWIVSQRPPRHRVDPWRPSAFFIEDERTASGEVVPAATIFLTNRECPWRCLMCDLWMNTLTEEVPTGAIPAQIDYALEQLEQSRTGVPPVPTGSQLLSSTASEISVSSELPDRRDARPTLSARQLKLYNSGSFFDPRAIPPEDYQAIALRVRSFERVIVECHPALVGAPALRFGGMLTAKLEVAMGLETVHLEVLARLNKRMTLEQFKGAAEFLRQNNMALRVFILVKPPFLDEDEALHWAKRSLDFAFDCGATAASLIPTRLGNGALEALAERGQFSPPKLSTLEAAAAYGISLGRGRVFADLWDLEKFSECPACWPARFARLREMNYTQTLRLTPLCPVCGSNA